MASDGLTRVVKLGVDNYMQWSLQIEHLMKSKGCWTSVEPIDERRPPPAGAPLALASTDGVGVAAAAAAAANATTANDAANPDKEGLAMALMVMNVDARHYATFRAHPTARGAWAALAARFRSRGPARELNLRRQLNTIRMGRGEDVVSYFNRAQTISWELGVLGVAIDDKHILSALLAGLSSKHDDARRFLSLQRGLTLDDALDDLLAAEARNELDGDHKDRTVDGDALAADTRPQRDPAKDEQHHKDRRARACFHCHKPGHQKRNCPERNKGDMEDKSDGAFAGIALMAMGRARVAGACRKAPRSNQWLIDSGASQHMTGYASKLTRVRACHPVDITMANGEGSTAVTEGTARLIISCEKGTRQLTLDNVLIVPGMTVSLFSVRRAARRGFTTSFTERTAYIQKGRTLITGTCTGALYALQEAHTDTDVGGVAMAAAPTTDGVERPSPPPSPAAAGRDSPRAPTKGGATSDSTATTVGINAVAGCGAPVAPSTWHRRAGHLAPDGMLKMASAVDGMNFSAADATILKSTMCAPCVTAKMTRPPFPTSSSSTTKVLQLLHTDVCGPMPTPSPGGRRYQVCIIDDHSKHKAIIPVHTKGQATDAVMALVNRWENELGVKTNTIRSDGGKEYTGAEWSAWLAAKGIRHETTTRYTPQQNGVAERYNRTITERVGALMADAALEPKWWADAAVAIHYVLAKRELQLGQRQNVTALLERFGMSDANPVLLPMAAGKHLTKEGEPLADKERSVYQALVGAVQYVATCTRPDIALVVGRLGRYSAAPTVDHMAAAKTLLRYLKGTATMSLTYGAEGPLAGYSDADFAGDVDSRRSTTGMLFTRNGAAVAWASKIQPTVAASTTEAEYVAGAAAAREAVWQRRLDRELGGPGKPVPLRCDNMGSIAMMNNPVSSTRTKHIDVCHHVVRDNVEAKEIVIEHVPTDAMMADSLTKPLPTTSFNRCRDAMGLKPMD